MNAYLENLNKIEFVVTYACLGRCKHCSQGEHEKCGERMDPSVAAEIVRRVSGAYGIQTVMTFGGEPLLYPDAVYKIHEAAAEMNVPRRQIITSGYFSTDISRIQNTAKMIRACGANDVLLSVDAFHQETIPLDTVKIFAEALVKNGVPVRLQPAWLVSAENCNPYNKKTREILREFCSMGIPENDGNIIFPEGRALEYLGEYFAAERPVNPYVDDPYDVRCASFEPSGNIFGKNVYDTDILKILDEYKP